MVVVGELAEQQEFIPVVLSFVRKTLQILLQFLVNLFGLAIGLWVIGCRKCLADAKESVQFMHEFSDELGAAVRQGSLGHPMVLPYLMQEEVGGTFGCDSSVHWYEVRMLAQ